MEAAFQDRSDNRLVSQPPTPLCRAAAGDGWQPTFTYHSSTHCGGLWRTTPSCRTQVVTSLLRCELSPEAPTPVAVMWDGIAQNVVRRLTVIWVIWRIARSGVVARVVIVTVIAIRVRIFRARWILGHRKRNSASIRSRLGRSVLILSWSPSSRFAAPKAIRTIIPHFAIARRH